MPRLLRALLLVSPFALAATAAAQVPVNIVYPIDGSTVPITDPAPPPLASAYITVSFGVTCSGDHVVEWGFDGGPAIGKAEFYDQISVQQVYKLAGGGHQFWVRASRCGDDAVKFSVGP